MSESLKGPAFLASFGSERADADYARRAELGDDDNIYLETMATQDFLERDPHYPFVLGTMGAGKSILLLKKWGVIEAASKEGAIIAPRSAGRVYTPSANFANTVRFTSYWQIERDGSQNVDAWTQVWEWALLGCVAKQWLNATHEDEVKPIRELREHLAQDSNLRDDPYDSIAQYLELTESKGVGPAGNPELPHPERLRSFMERHANSFPPTFVFLDNQDDFFNDAPDFWTASTLGCKYAIDQLHRRSDHRVHFFLTLRPETLWRVEAAADAARGFGDVFRIEWTQEQLIEMFARRAAKLQEPLLAAPRLRQSNPLAAFFGSHFYDTTDRHFEKPYISNYGAAKHDPISEPLGSYLLRHTLGRPREIILLGNQILHTRRIASPNARWGQGAVREAVAAASHTIALAYIGEIKHRWQWRRPGETAEEAIKRFLRDHVETNVIPVADLQQIEARFLETCERKPSPYEKGPFTVMASAGLIGWPRSDLGAVGRFRQYFPQPGSIRELQIPQTCKQVLVHPVLYGEPFNILTKKGVVVGPDLAWNKGGANG